MLPALRRLRRPTLRDPLVAAATVVLLGVTIAAVIVFFPRSDTPAPRAEALWPGRAEQLLGPLDEVPAWPGGAVLLALRDFAPNTSAAVRLDDAETGGIFVGANGTGRGRVTLPAQVTHGTHQLFVRDAGTGNDAPAVRVVVVHGPEAHIWAGPDPLPHRSALLVGAGFTPGSVVTLALADQGAARRDLGHARVRRDGRFAVLVGLPPDVPKGSHRVLARDAEARSASDTVVIAHGPHG